MTIRNIRIFLAVVNHHNNISEAARSLYLSQPSVSVAIQEIEREYQLQLFERLSRRLYLTDAGQEFLEYAQRIASTFDDMDRQLKEKKDHETIRIGASITIGSRRMPEYVKQFQSCHPLAEVFVKVGFSRDLEKMLLVNELDLALVETPVHNKELEAEKYAADRLDLVMPATQGYEANLEMPLERFLQEDILLREKGSGRSALGSHEYDCAFKRGAERTRRYGSAASDGGGCCKWRTCGQREHPENPDGTGVFYCVSSG